MHLLHVHPYQYATEPICEVLEAWVAAKFVENGQVFYKTGPAIQTPGAEVDIIAVCQLQGITRYILVRRNGYRLGLSVDSTDDFYTILLVDHPSGHVTESVYHDAVERLKQQMRT